MNSPISASSLRRAAIGSLILMLGAGSLCADDIFVLPSGAGDMSGSSFDNALAADQLSSTIAAMQPGDTLHLGSGQYKGTFSIATGGTGKTARKVITGVDTGSGLPVFKGAYTLGDTKGGGTLCTIESGVAFVTLKDLKAENYAQCVRLRGQNEDLLIENIDIDNVRDAFWVDGGGSNAGGKNLVFKDCDVTMFVKRGFRILNGISDSQFINCTADAGGEKNALEVFAVGFHVLGGKDGVVDSGITFTNCVASNAWHNPGGDKYWNADGFAAERPSKDLTFIGCLAFGNTDGGWDLKSDGIRLQDCVGIDNKRNFRFWDDVTMENCLSAYSHDRGPKKHDLGFWVIGGSTVELIRCTFWGDRKPISVEKASAEKPVKITLKDCLVATEPGGQGLPDSGGSITVETPGSEIAEASSIKLKAPSKDWRGGDQSFDSTSHPAKGYHFVKAAPAR